MWSVVWLGSDLVLGLIMWDETQPLEHLGNVCVLDGKIGKVRASSVVGRADHKTPMSLWRGEAFSTHHLPARALGCVSFVQAVSDMLGDRQGWPAWTEVLSLSTSHAGSWL